MYRVSHVGSLFWFLGIWLVLLPRAWTAFGSICPRSPISQDVDYFADGATAWAVKVSHFWVWRCGWAPRVLGHVSSADSLSLKIGT
jgi:hypothetical protein